ncbi:MAG: hypothetical protein IPM23_21150 [Candidatus Melainabacteria bacterium]|nr:hypothetical protein [Candidatus Melainabacteria bacterium]
MIKTVSPALKALVESLIDYAGLFPPAGLPLEIALANYQEYRSAPRSFMLRSFVLKEGDMEKAPGSLDGHFAVLAERPVTELIERAASFETTYPASCNLPVYCEVGATGNIDELDRVKESGNFAKIRCGGVKPEAIPSVEAVAAFIRACASSRLAFKATAGLHHPLRAEQALTYEGDAPRAVTHGFLNVLLASAFAFHGDDDIEPILRETDPAVFRFDERAHFKDRSLSEKQIRTARRDFVHSIGSCSFEEPVADLETLGLL